MFNKIVEDDSIIFHFFISCVYLIKLILVILNLHIKTLVCFLVVLFSLLFHAKGQSPENNLEFTHLMQKDGLVHNSMNCILQDSVGYMWFGTNNGLSRYDGLRFTSYVHKSGDNSSLPSNDIVWMFEDSKYNHWIGTNNGLCQYIRETDSFKQIPLLIDTLTQKDISVHHIMEDSDGLIWVSSYTHGIFVLEPSSVVGKMKVTRYFHKPDDSTSIQTNSIRYIAEDKTGTIWVGGRHSVVDLYSFDKNTRAFTKHFGHSETNFSNTIFTLFVDSENDLWVGTWGSGINKRDAKTGEFSHYKNKRQENSICSNLATSIIESSPGIFWIGTRSAGLNKFYKSTEHFIQYKHEENNPNSLSNNHVTCVYKSKNGVLWVGNTNGGVNKANLNGKKFVKYNPRTTAPNGMNSENVTAMLETKNGDIWIGTIGGGINVLDKKTHTFSYFIYSPEFSNTISNNMILSLFEDSDERIWVGTNGSGISRIKFSGNKVNGEIEIDNFAYSPADKIGITNNYIRTFCEDNFGNVWFGSFGGGLGVFSKKNESIYNFPIDLEFPNEITHNAVVVLRKDSFGNLWVGTHGSGMKVFTPSENPKETPRFIHFNHNPKQPNSLANFNVNDILFETSKLAWIATYNGLSKLEIKGADINDKNTKFVFTTYRKQSGLPDNKINSIQQDKNGNLWLGTENGLCKFDTKTMKCSSFSKSDGLQSNSYAQAASISGKNGKMYFGGPKGFDCFFPDSIRPNTNIPNVVITDFKVFNQSVQVGDSIYGTVPLSKSIYLTKHIELSYKASVFSFEFASLDFTNPEKNKFKYTLVGFNNNDNQWTDVTANRNIATYTNLSPGSYVFKLKGSNADGIWNEKATEIKITIKPPFWQTYWFKGVMVFLVVLIFNLVYIYRVRRVESQKKQLQIMVNERTNELNELNALLEEQNQEISTQKEALEKNKKLLENKVTKRTSELKRAKEKAEESDRLKTAFLANMSHEVRTPLNAISGFMQFIMDPKLSNTEKQEFVNIINSSVESLLVLVNDILELSLIESNQLSIKFDSFSLNEHLKDLFMTFKQSHAAKSIKFELFNNIDHKNYYITSDKFRLKQILLNYLSNAYKFTDKGQITLSVNLDKSNLLFSVSDTGVGIPENQIDCIFERFRKLDENKTRIFRGAGLGLSISKSLAELMGGKVWVESQVDKGSAFFLSIPLILSQNSIAHKAPANADIYDWSGKMILIAEDEETNYMFLKHALKKTNVNVIWVKNGREAFDLFLNGKKFDAVLMDIKMPEMDGYQATELIKKVDPEQIIIAQTAYARTTDQKKMRELGFDDFIAKPIRPDNLLTVLGKYICSVN